MLIPNSDKLNTWTLSPKKGATHEEFRAFLYVAQVAATSDRLKELVRPPLTPEKIEVSA